MRLGFECYTEELSTTLIAKSDYCEDRRQWRFFWDAGLHISFPWFSVRYAVVDIETSGLDGKGSPTITTDTRKTRVNISFIVDLGLFDWMNR